MKRINFLLACIMIVNLGIYTQIPAGYYHFAKDKKKDELKTALHQHGTPLKVLNYGSELGATWQGFFYTDQRADGSIYDMYSPIVRSFSGYSSVSGMHIEHSLPKSWWGAHENNAYKDLHHLFPSDGPINSSKNNFPLGEVGDTWLSNNGMSKVGQSIFSQDYTGNSFEPANEYKGDFARAYLYMSTIYQDLAALWNSPMMQNNTYPVWRPWAKELLLKWHAQDPVSQKEIDRNEVVYSFQGNRNPFIDYPTLANHIWGPDTLVAFPFPNETEGFIVVPRRGFFVDFGISMLNNQKTVNIPIVGVNIGSTLSFSLKQNTDFELSTSTMTAADVSNGASLAVIFKANNPGTRLDTLIVSGGGMISNMFIPLRGLASADFIALPPTNATPVGGKLQWMEDPNANSYLLNVYTGEQKAGDLIISSYIEGSSWNKAIEIYNGTGQTINLADYTLRKQSNGEGDFATPYRLSGNLAHNSTLLIAHISATEALKNIANALTDSVLQFNGNDAVALYRKGIMVDIVGHANAGSVIFWGEDLSLHRKQNITHPNAVYNTTEWQVFGIDYFAGLKSHTMQFANNTQHILQNQVVSNANYYNISALVPNTRYTYNLVSVRNAGNLASVNSMQLMTLSPETPIAMSADDIRSNGFTANWEENLYNTDFLLNVFQLTGQADTTVVEGFDNAATSTKTLPNGWSGRINGYYSTTTSSGIAPPSVQLANTNDSLVSPRFDIPISKINFMYKWASAGTGSSLIVEVLKNNQWQKVDSIRYINLSRYYPTYNFARAENISKLRIRYNKTGGNIAIDDVNISYGNQDTIFVLQNHFVENSNIFAVRNLEPETQYYYQLRSVIANQTSALSETIAVKTHILSSTQNNSFNVNNVKVFGTDNKIMFDGLKTGDKVSLYNISGVRIGYFEAQNSFETYTFDFKGLIIIKIQNEQKSISKKIIR